MKYVSFLGMQMSLPKLHITLYIIHICPHAIKFKQLAQIPKAPTVLLAHLSVSLQLVGDEHV